MEKYNILLTVVSGTRDGILKNTSVLIDSDKSVSRASTSFLAQDIRSMILTMERVPSDVSLVWHKTKIKAHKTILAARSDVFAAMFQHDGTKEAATKEVEISDTDIRTLRRFIRYEYE